MSKVREMKTRPEVTTHGDSLKLNFGRRFNVQQHTDAFSAGTDAAGARKLPPQPGRPSVPTGSVAPSDVLNPHQRRKD